MSTNFDPYHEWLGISPDEQPADYYRLLGLRLFESNPDVINNAADARMGYVRTFQTGRRSLETQRILNELSLARTCLLSPDRRAEYDAQLRAKQELAKPKVQVVAKPLPARPVPIPQAVARPVVPPQPLPLLPPQSSPLTPVRSPAGIFGNDPFLTPAAGFPSYSSQSPAEGLALPPLWVMLLSGGVVLFLSLLLVMVVVGRFSATPQREFAEVKKQVVTPPEVTPPGPPSPPPGPPPVPPAIPPVSPTNNPPPISKPPVDVVVSPQPKSNSRFVDRGEYVEDTKTGLQWQKDGSASGELKFFQAEEYSKELKLGGLTDWRLPTAVELAEIFPATEAPFTNTKYTSVEGGIDYWTGHKAGRVSGKDYSILFSWSGAGIQPDMSVEKIIASCAKLVDASVSLCHVRCVRGAVRDIDTLKIANNKSGAAIEASPPSIQTTGPIQRPIRNAGPQVPIDVEMTERVVSKDGRFANLARCTEDHFRRLVQFPNIESILLNGADPISKELFAILASLPKLRDLTIFDCQYFSDRELQELGTLKRLKSLSLHSVVLNLRTLDFLENLTELDRFVFLDSVSVTPGAFRPLAQARKVTFLQIEEGGDEALQAALKIPALKILVAPTDISDVGLADVSGATTLFHLDLSACPGLTSAGFSRFPKLSNLKSLNLPIHADSNFLKGMESVSNLTTLNCGSLELDDLTSLASLTNLKSLSLRVKANTSLEPLRSMKNLESLYIGPYDFLGHGPDVLSQLPKLRSLRILTMKGTFVQQSSGKSRSRFDRTLIAGLSEMQFAALAKLQNIKNIVLSDVRLSGAEQQRLKAALQGCNVQFPDSQN